MKKYFFILTACLTVGLAPYSSEPHLVGKLRWILGGAQGMQMLDWGDALMHGSPWLVLLYFVVRDLLPKSQTPGA